MELDNWAPHIGWDDQLLLRLQNSGYSSYSQHGSHNHYSGHYNPGYNSWHHSADYSYYSGQQQQGRAEAATQTQAEWSGEVCRCPGCPAPGGQEDFLDQLDRKVSPPS